VKPFDALYAKYGDKAGFATVYIAEVHPQDGFALPGDNGGFGAVLQATTMEERICTASHWFAKMGLKVPYYVDLMTNECDETFDALPERIYILEGDRVVFQGGQGPFDFRLEPVAKWLEARFGV